MSNIISATTVVREVFESFEKLHRANVLKQPEGIDMENFMYLCRSKLYAELSKKPPLNRLDNKKFQEQKETKWEKCVFVFYGNVKDIWYPLNTKLSPQSVNIDEITTSNEIFIDTEGWIYNIRCPGIRLGVYI